MNGRVALVGAGPGDPELLTLKAVRCLQEADLVLYDALVDPEVLNLAPDARRFYVGKRGGRPSFKQHDIEALMIKAASRGEYVVRLKCGDPFVLGRGGEEAIALSKAGIPFEVVPGVTSAISAPLLAGIPVTHRGVSPAFLMLSGHTRESWSPILKSVSPNSVTLVVLMGLRSRMRLSDYLIQQGWRSDTPVAVLLAASSPNAETWTGTLRSLRDAFDHLDYVDSPGTIVIGDVVDVAQQIRPMMTHSSAELTSSHKRAVSTYL